jgi:hypothetical protein
MNVKVDDVDSLLSQMNSLVTINTKTMSLLGARSMVLGNFFDAVLPHLTTAQRVETSQSFRNSIEETMSQMDDVPLPVEYHSAMLQLTNAILATLREPSVRSK